jgi:A/G-specific adenine glycosylase
MGYYRRARHLHAAARQITRRGEFPRSSEALQELPGIGRYTAAAIASIAFGECCAVVDGNVERVLQRITGQALSNQVAWQAAEQFLSRRRPGDFNQAMMELGATVCTPKAPHCQACPVARFCKTQGEHRFRKAVPRVRRRLAYALCVKADLVLLARRSSDASVMAGMWELPEISFSQTRNEMPIVRLRHSIMNTDYQVLVYGPARRSFNTVERVTQPQPMWVPKARLDCLPLTGLAKKILRKTSVMHPEAAIDSATPSSKTIFSRIWIR